MAALRSVLVQDLKIKEGKWVEGIVTNFKVFTINPKTILCREEEFFSEIAVALPATLS